MTVTADINSSAAGCGIDENGGKNIATRAHVRVY